MRVLVLWADDHSANLGVRALAHGSAAIIRQRWGDDTEIVFQDFPGRDTGVPIRKETLLSDAGRRNGPIKNLLGQFDLVWDTGAGDSLADIYGYARLARMLYVQRVAVTVGVPLVFGPQTIGPFRSRMARDAAVMTLRRATAVLTRDSASAHYVEALGVPPAAVSTDVVFALPQPAPADSRDVVFNVSGLLWDENRHVTSSRYRQSVADMCRELTARGREVTVMTHVISNGSRDDDTGAATHVAHELGLELVTPSSLVDARSTLCSAQLVIGSRMHACLNALSTGTATIPWAYSRKFAPLLADLGWDAVVDLRTDVDPVRSTLDRIDAEQDFAEALSAVGRNVAERLSAASNALDQVQVTHS